MAPRTSKKANNNDAGGDGGKKKKPKQKKSAVDETGEDQPKQLEKPRRYTTAYMAFNKASWAEYKAAATANPDDYPAITREVFKQFTRECAAKWAEMDEQERAPYEEQSAAGKAAYQEAMVAYKAKQLELKGATQKRPLGSYMLYCADERPKVRQELGPQAKVVEVARELGRRWTALPEEEKETYKEKATRAREEYNGLKTVASTKGGERKKKDKSTKEDNSGDSSRRPLKVTFSVTCALSASSSSSESDEEDENGDENNDNEEEEENDDDNEESGEEDEEDFSDEEVDGE